jgi:hypothetical protein
VRESAQSWHELLVDIKQRGLEIAPDLAIGDGALGFWKVCIAAGLLIFQNITTPQTPAAPASPKSVFVFGAPHQAGDANFHSGAQSWWQIPAVLSPEKPDSPALEHTTATVRLLDPTLAATYGDTHDLRLEAPGEAGRYGVPELTLEPGKRYYIGLVARIDDGSDENWAAAITDEARRLHGKGGVILPPNGKYKMKIEVRGKGICFASPVYTVNVPDINQSNGLFVVEVDQAAPALCQ